MIRLLVLAIVLGLLTWLFQRRLVRAVGLPGLWAKTATAILILLAAMAVVGMSSGDLFDPTWARPMGFMGLTWFAMIFYLLLGLGLIGLVCLGARVVRRVQGRPTPPPEPSRRHFLRGATAGLVLGSTATVGYGLVAAARPRVSHTTIRLARLPAGFNGIRVALITDLHIGPARGRDFTQKVVDLVLEQKPDLVVYGGDLTDGTVDYVGPDLRPLAHVKAPLGTFGVSGNHEYYADGAEAWMTYWETLGIRPLRNERVALRRDGDEIDLAGIFDATAPAPHEPDLARAVAGRDSNRFLLLAAHQPSQVEDARTHGVDLQLSGHTHGGQVWPFDYAVRLDQPMVDGLAEFGSTQVFASRGAGAWGPPVRVGAPPEVAILELVQKR
ncbi:metallophosphoesterase [Demetria terragena]|uniref:metallophosphoesterase n=1 Tax=Demetria terragena TaxID=63959 RepID=UPI000373EA5D|nr:metallophosphoesterase [Demetria terragena]